MVRQYGYYLCGDLICMLTKHKLTYNEDDNTSFRSELVLQILLEKTYKGEVERARYIILSITDIACESMQVGRKSDAQDSLGHTL